MNSLEKLIADLDDSHEIIANEVAELISRKIELDFPWPSREELMFVKNALQSAINRLKALNEEIEVTE